MSQPPTIYKEQLIQQLAEAFEQLIAAATDADRRGTPHPDNGWGPREVVAHMAGWEVMASVRVPKIVAGMRPLEETDAARQVVMNDAINATIVTMIGDQPLAAVCGLLRQAYQRDIEILKGLDDSFFQPGEYVYERTKSVIDHCHEHMEGLVLKK